MATEVDDLRNLAEGRYSITSDAYSRYVGSAGGGYPRWMSPFLADHDPLSIYQKALSLHGHNLNMRMITRMPESLEDKSPIFSTILGNAMRMDPDLILPDGAGTIEILLGSQFIDTECASVSRDRTTGFVYVRSKTGDFKYSSNITFAHEIAHALVLMRFGAVHSDILDELIPYSLSQDYLPKLNNIFRIAAEYDVKPQSLLVEWKMDSPNLPQIRDALLAQSPDYPISSFAALQALNSRKDMLTGFDLRYPYAAALAIELRTRFGAKARSLAKAIYRKGTEIERVRGDGDTDTESPYLLDVVAKALNLNTDDAFGLLQAAAKRVFNPLPPWYYVLN